MASSTFDVDFLRRDECQPMTTAQMESAKAQIRPRNRANVNIVPYHIYDEDEHTVGEWRETINGVKKKKPVYEKTFHDLPYINVSVSNVERVLNWNAVRKYESGSIYHVNMDGTQKANYMLGQFSNNTFVLKELASAYNAGNVITATIRYTKTTDEWEEVDE